MHRCAQGFANARNPSTVISITVSLHLEILSGDIISVPLTRLSLTSSEIMGRSNDAAKGTEEILDDDYFVKQYQQMTNKVGGFDFLVYIAQCTLHLLDQFECLMCLLSIASHLPRGA